MEIPDSPHGALRRLLLRSFDDTQSGNDEEWRKEAVSSELSADYTV